MLAGLGRIKPPDSEGAAVHSSSDGSRAARQPCTRREIAAFYVGTLIFFAWMAVIIFKNTDGEIYGKPVRRSPPRSALPEGADLLIVSRLRKRDPLSASVKCYPLRHHLRLARPALVPFPDQFLVLSKPCLFTWRVLPQAAPGRPQLGLESNPASAIVPSFHASVLSSFDSARLSHTTVR